MRMILPIRALAVAALLTAVPAFAQPAAPGYGPGPCPFDASSCLATPTDGTTARAEKALISDSLNILGFGVGGAAVDRTGATDASGAIQAAVTKACSLTPRKPVYIPQGTYDVLTKISKSGSCDNLTIIFDPGAMLKADASNVSNPALLQFINMKDLNILYATLDGNTSAIGTANQSPLVQLNWPTDRVTLVNPAFQNSSGTALNNVGEQPISGTLSGTQAAGQAVLTFTSFPAGLAAGAYVVLSACMDPDMYVISTNSGANQATMNRNLPDTCLAGTAQFTHAFTSNANNGYGDTSISTGDTSGLTVGETIATQSACLQANTRILTITTNVSITIDKAIQCPIASSTNYAAAGGNSNLTLANPVWNEIGLVNLNTSTRNYTTSGSSVAGNTLTLACLTGAGCSQGTVLPGQMTGPSGLPAGVPVNDLVTAVSCNTGAGTCALTLQNPLTGTVTTGQTVAFTASRGGVGYGIWHSWGAPFANLGVKIDNPRATHTWSAPIYLAGTKDATVIGGELIEDELEFRDAVTAPSPCIYGTATDGLQVSDAACRGATGTGLEAEHPINLSVAGGDYSANGLGGVGIAGGHDVTIRTQARNNGQWVNVSYVGDLATRFGATAGVGISGSGTTSQAGTATAFNIGPIDVSDTQVTPTQTYGLSGNNAASVYSGLFVGSVTGASNITALINPSLTGTYNSGPSGSTLYTAASGTITQTPGALWLEADVWGGGGPGAAGATLGAAGSGSGGGGGGGGEGPVHFGPALWASLGATTCTYAISAQTSGGGTASDTTLTCNSIVVATARHGGAGSAGQSAAGSAGGGGAGINDGGAGSGATGGATGAGTGAAGGSATTGGNGSIIGGSGGAGDASAAIGSNGGATQTGPTGGGAGGGCNGASPQNAGTGGTNHYGGGGSRNSGGVTPGGWGSGTGAGGGDATAGTANNGGDGGAPAGGGGGGGAGCNGTGTAGAAGKGARGQIIARQG